MAPCDLRLFVTKTECSTQQR